MRGNLFLFNKKKQRWNFSSKGLSMWIYRGMSQLNSELLNSQGIRDVSFLSILSFSENPYKSKLRI